MDNTDKKSTSEKKAKAKSTAKKTKKTARPGSARQTKKKTTKSKASSKPKDSIDSIEKENTKHFGEPTRWTLFSQARTPGETGEEARGVLYKFYWNTVYYRFLDSGLEDPDNRASDFFHEIFFPVIVTSANRGNQRPGRFRSYLKLILFRYITDAQRKEYRKAKYWGKYKEQITAQSGDPAVENTAGFKDFSTHFDADFVNDLLGSVLAVVETEFLSRLRCPEGKRDGYKKHFHSIFGVFPNSPNQKTILTDKDLAKILGTSDGNLKQVRLRLRNSFNLLLRKRLQSFVPTDEIEEEALELVKVWLEKGLKGRKKRSGR